MRLLKYMLPLLVLLIGSAAVSADYDPTSPPEPGVNFTLTTRCVPEGAANDITPTAPHAFGSTVRLTTRGNSGFTFVAWVTPDDEVVSETREFDYTMPARDVELIAKYVYNPSDPEEPGSPEFKEMATIRFSQSPAGAAYAYYVDINGSNQYPEEAKLEVGSTIVLTATGTSKYDFVNWTRDGVVMAETRVWEYTVEAGTHEIVANFQYNPDNPEEPGENMFVRTLTVKANPEGAARVYGGGTYNYGQSVRVYDSVNRYYTFINWTDDLGEVVSTSRDFYYTIPNREVTLTANYSYNYDPDSPEEPGEPIPDGSIAENMVAYPRFGMYDDTHVMILCETEGSTIYYTIDGSDPTEESAVYTEPIFVPSNVLVKAIAFKEGMDHSPIRSYQVTVYRTAAPKFTFVNRKIELTSETPDASIFYTLDFSEPTPESTRYTTAIEPEENCRIKAIATAEGLSNSEVSVFVYRRADYTLNAPTFSLNDEGKLVITPPIEGGETYYTYTAEGEEPTYESTRYTGPITLDGNGIIRAFTYHINYFDSPASDYAVTGFVVATPTVNFTNPMLSFSTATTGAQIRYTTDGSVPTEEAALYENPLRLTADCTVTARGFKANYEPSESVSFAYVYRDYMLPTPTASFENKVLTLTCADADAQIHYTIDDTTPGEESALYTAPIALTEDCTVRFIATRENFNPSEEGSFVFVYTAYRVATPEFSYDNVNKMLSMSCSTEDAVIRYTTDGSEPTAESTLYENPVEVVGNLTFNARAFKEGFFDSAVASLSINDQSVPTPTASFANKQLTLTCSDADASIYYTIDRSTPTTSSTLYEGPVALTEDCTVKFIATHENFNDSPEGSFDFVRSYYAVATPEFDYNREAGTISITCATENAEIRYTTDGTVPESNTGTVYTAPINVTANLTYTARAFRSDLFDSEPAPLTVDNMKVPDPVASFANRVLTLTCPDSQAQIRYTTDGTEPTADSPLYEGPISLTADCTVRFVAMHENLHNSEIVSFQFVYANYRVAAPTFSYDPTNKLVTMACATDNAEIRYTTDGTDPTTASALYTEAVPVIGNLTFKAIGVRTDLFDSWIATLAINDQKVETPTASFANKLLTLTCSDDQAQIRYTTDDTAPTAASTLYEGPVALTADCIVRFIAIRANFNNSDEGSYNFVRAEHSVATPVLTYNTGNRTVTMACATENVEIHYTTDGTNPTAASALYTTAVAVTGNMTFKAIGIRSDLFDSEIATLPVNDLKVPTPTASYANKQLTLSCTDNQAQIYYTIDDPAPTANSTLYSGPISLTRSCTVYFIAVRANYNNSDVASFVFAMEDQTVATPAITYNSGNGTVTITCSTANAEIRYTTDGSEPTATSALYSAPITVSGNMTVRARAFRSDLFDSDIATLTISDQKVATPTASYANKQLTLTCSDNQAQIRYTTDGTAPTANSTLYEGPIALSADCTVRFIAVRANYNNSDEGSFNFAVADYTVATPVVTYNSDNSTVTITCGTANAEIRYTLDGSEPTATTGIVYTGPITVTENMTVTARAFRSDLFDSASHSDDVNDKKVQTPSASYAAHAVTLSCRDTDAAIHYTTDGSAPTATSTLYTAPIPVSDDVTINFIAVKANLNNSDPATHVFRLADYKEAKPEVTPDYRNRKLNVAHSASASVNVTIGNSTTNHTIPATLDVTPDMSQVSVVAVASNHDRFDSDPTVENIVFHLEPEINFNGKTLTVAPNSADPNPVGVTRNVTFNGTTMSNDVENVTFDVQEFGTVTAFVESDSAFYSETATRRIDFFNTGATEDGRNAIAGARNGHSLSEAFGGHGDSLSEYKELTVVGEIGRDDLGFLATLPALATVTLNPASITTESCDGVLSGSRIETITLPVAPEGLLKGMPRLTSVVWAAAEAMPEGRLSEAGNPNLLLWVNDKALAPADASNVVVGGVAEKIVLRPGYPFNAFMEFTADSVELTKSFDLATGIGVCQGWETIALPFAPQRIYHESKGDVTPFAAWDGNDDSPKPFWLYSASATGWDEASEIVAGKPYIISMPNNPEYIEAFNINGDITFAAENATIRPDMAEANDWVQGMTFEATFMPVEGSVRSLNSRAAADSEDLPGSVFIPEAETLPFEAYVANTASRRRIPLFADWSDVTLPTLSPAGVVVEALGGGKVRISSGREFTAEIYTLTGMRVRSAHIAPGESVIIDGLAKGIYIVAGSKISIN